ncbi:MAG: hypothetical protein NW215_12230 [Hyphomicrobiales bacterium]|nr:hypothetical protein [Hyphomicrobiales bacterium]
MARYITLLGLASIVVADDADDIDAFLNHAALDRDYAPRGPLINRIIVGRARTEFTLQGRYWLSLRGRRDPERVEGQAALTKLLNGYAAEKPWPPDAIAAMADYVRGVGKRRPAAAALAYAVAMPFRAATPGGSAGFNREQYAQIFRLYERIAAARSLFSPRGAFIRLNGGAGRARQALLTFMGGDVYGLHAVAVTLDNALPVLDAMRSEFAASGKRTRGTSPSRGPSQTPPWLRVRTAPVLVMRQSREPVTLPQFSERLPAHTLFLLRMRRSLAAEPPGGYEFASGAWSYCPATRYLHALYASVWAAAVAPGRQGAAQTISSPVEAAA